MLMTDASAISPASQNAVSKLTLLVYLNRESIKDEIEKEHREAAKKKSPDGGISSHISTFKPPLP
jgi:hypothetical protein